MANSNTYGAFLAALPLRSKSDLRMIPLCWMRPRGSTRGIILIGPRDRLRVLNQANNESSRTFGPKNAVILS